jgi:DNA-binding response OmpR family regulator
MTNLADVPSGLGARVLVVDDELHVRLPLARSLALQGYHADSAASGSQALEMLGCAHYDVLVLDIRMPGMDGVEVMRHTRQAYPDLLVIILTGHATLESAITAVKCGAVDYLLKPASVHDVAAVIAAALHQRTGRVRGTDMPLQSSPAPASEHLLHVGLVTLDLERRTVAVAREGSSNEHSVRLTASEVALLLHLMQHTGVVFSCQELARAALGYGVSEQEARAIVHPHISRLRKKIEDDPARPNLIQTTPGGGYLFAPWPQNVRI